MPDFWGEFYGILKVILTGISQNRRLHPDRKIADSPFVFQTEKSSPTPNPPKKRRCPSPSNLEKKVANAPPTIIFN